MSNWPSHDSTDNAEWKSGEDRYFMISIFYPYVSKSGTIDHLKTITLARFDCARISSFFLSKILDLFYDKWRSKLFDSRIIHSFSLDLASWILKIYIFIELYVDFFLNKFRICRLFFIMINDPWNWNWTLDSGPNRRISNSSSDIYATFVISPLVQLLLEKFPL